VLNPFSRPRVSNDKPLTQQSLFRNGSQYVPDYPETTHRSKTSLRCGVWRRFLSAAYNHWPATSGIQKSFTPHSAFTSGAASTNLQERAISTQKPVGPIRRRWSNHDLWRQPEECGIQQATQKSHKSTLALTISEGT